MNVSLQCAVFLFMSFTFSLKASDLDDVIPELYELYKETIAHENNISSRRVFKRNKQYEMHIKKLKEVNGLKYHNLVLKEYLRNDPNEYIYISNPLESKMSKAFLTIDEFKKELTNRIERQLITTTTVKNTNTHALSKFPKTKVTRKKHKHTKRGSKKRKKMKSTISFNTVKDNNIIHVKNNKSYVRKANKTSEIKSKIYRGPSNFGKTVKTSHTKRLSTKFYRLQSKLKTTKETIGYPDVTSKNIFVKRKTTIKVTPKIKTTFGITTVKRLLIKRGTDKRKSIFGDTTIRKFPTSTITPIGKSTFDNTTTVKLTSSDITPRKNSTIEHSTFVGTEMNSTKLMHLRQITKEISTEMLTTSKKTPRNISTYVDVTVKNTTTTIYAAQELRYEDSTTDTATTPNNIFRRESTFEHIKIINKIVPSTGQSTHDYLKSKAVTTTELLGIQPIIKDVEKVKIGTSSSEPNNELLIEKNALKVKPLITPEEILRSYLNIGSTTTKSLYAPKKFGSATFENTTTEPLASPKLNDSQKLIFVNKERLTNRKRTPRRKKKARYINTSIKTTKYKRLGRPLVFMGGYGQPVL